jgi:hypothetical protein
MDWTIFWYFLAAVVAAGVSYAIWPKERPSHPNIISDERQSRPRLARRHRPAA